MSLIDAFVEATEGIAAPENFRKWSGYTIISSLMSRRVWTETITGAPLFGNLFTVLVGGPGSGKTFTIENAKRCLRPYAEYVSISNNDCTYAEICRQLSDTFLVPELAELTSVPDRSYNINAEEIASFIPEADIRQMQAMASWWSGLGDEWSKGTKSAGTDNIWGSYVTMLAGAQPAWFQQVLGSNGLELGLPSRLLYIYYPDEIPLTFFGPRRVDMQLEAYIKRLAIITRVKGHIPWTEEAQERLKEWYDLGCPDALGKLRIWTGQVLKDYKRRRPQHLAKLALVLAIARHPNHRIIELSDLEAALADMWTIEDSLPFVMDLVSGNPFRNRERVVMDYVKEYCKDGLMIPEAVVRKKLGENIPTTMVNTILTELIATKQLKDAEPERWKHPNRKFIPGAQA